MRPSGRVREEKSGTILVWEGICGEQDLCLGNDAWILFQKSKRIEKV